MTTFRRVWSCLGEIDMAYKLDATQLKKPGCRQKLSGSCYVEREGDGAVKEYVERRGRRRLIGIYREVL